jgi:hypothetical protein
VGEEGVWCEGNWIGIFGRMGCELKLGIRGLFDFETLSCGKY